MPAQRETWPGDKELSVALRAVSSASTSKIVAVAKVVMKYYKYYKQIVHAVEKSTRKRPPKQKLVALYILDAILRHSKAKYGEKDVFAPRFARNIEETFALVLEGPKQDRKSIQKVVGVWTKRKYFNQIQLDMLHSMLSEPRENYAVDAGDSDSDDGGRTPPGPPPVHHQQHQQHQQQQQHYPPQQAYQQQQQVQPVIHDPRRPPAVDPRAALDPRAAALLGQLAPHISPTANAPLTAYSDNIAQLLSSVLPQLQQQQQLPVAPTGQPTFPPPQQQQQQQQQQQHQPQQQQQQQQPYQQQQQQQHHQPPQQRGPGGGHEKYIQHGFPGFVPITCQDGAAPGMVRLLSTTLWVGNVPDKGDHTSDYLQEVFSPYGNVDGIRVLSQMAFVKYRSRAAAEKARLEVHGKELGNPVPFKIGWGRGTAIPNTNFDWKLGESFLSQSIVDGIGLAYEDVGVPEVVELAPVRNQQDYSNRGRGNTGRGGGGRNNGRSTNHRGGDRGGGGQQRGGNRDDTYVPRQSVNRDEFKGNVISVKDPSVQMNSARMQMINGGNNNEQNNSSNNNNSGPADTSWEDMKRLKQQGGQSDSGRSNSSSRNNGRRSHSRSRSSDRRDRDYRSHDSRQRMSRDDNYDRRSRR